MFNENNINEIKLMLPGFFQGITRVCISYPFDYIRLNIQTGKDKEIIGSLKKNYRNIYRGIFFPLIFVPIDRGITFYLYEKIKNNKEINNNRLLAGIIPSVISNIYMTPINVLNANYIYHDKISLKNIIKNNIFNKIYSGFGIETIRNTCGSFLFLYSYSFYDEIINSPFINGSLSSLTMWTFLYPLDTIKVNRFIFKESYYNIIKGKLLQDLYKGISLVYLRSIPSAGAGMVVYEYLKKEI